MTLSMQHMLARM